jgi:hypothetical protein
MCSNGYTFYALTIEIDVNTRLCFYNCPGRHPLVANELGYVNPGCEHDRNDLPITFEQTLRHDENTIVAMVANKTLLSRVALIC